MSVFPENIYEKEMVFGLEICGKEEKYQKELIFFLRIVQHEIFTNYDVTYNNYRKYAMVVMNVQTQDRRHKV